MTDEQKAAIVAMLLGPKRVETDAGEVEQRDAKDMEAAIDLIEKMSSTKKGVQRFQKMRIFTE